MSDQEPTFNQKDISDANGPIDTFVDGAGKTRMGVDSQVNVTVDELLGRDPIPDTYLTVTNAGALNDTVRVQIAGTSKDTSTPDRDLPAVDKTITLTANEAGDEIKTAELIASDLNADTGFQNAKLVAEAITTGRRAIVHITVDEDEFSLGGEFSERPNVNDVQVSVTGTTTILLNSDKLISRGKVISLARDPANPHALGILGISGSVTALPGTIDNTFEEFAKNGGSDNLLVDGSGTPVVFTINAAATIDVAIGSFHFFAIGSAFKFGQFLGRNTTLSNGVEIKIIANDGKEKTLFLIKNTEDFENLFATSPIDNKLDSLPSGDNLKSVRRPRGSAILRKGTSDRIEIKIQDDLSITGVADDFKFFARGFET